LYEDAQAMRAAAQGRRPMMGMRYAERASSEEPEPVENPPDLGGAPS